MAIEIDGWAIWSCREASAILGLYNGDEVFKLFERESRHSLTLYEILSQAETG